MWELSQDYKHEVTTQEEDDLIPEGNLVHCGKFQTAGNFIYSEAFE